jgi:hypothetical protein
VSAPVGRLYVVLHNDGSRCSQVGIGDWEDWAADVFEDETLATKLAADLDDPASRGTCGPHRVGVLVLADSHGGAYAQWRSGEPTCEYQGCTNRIAHAETIGTGRRHWCEPHMPRSHYECPDPCARLVSEARERGSRWPNR